MNNVGVVDMFSSSSAGKGICIDQEQSKNEITAHISIPSQASLLHQHGITLLHMAVQNGYKMVVETLLRAGADLLRAGADKEVVDRDGDTPLHKAGSFNHEEIAAILLKAGAKTEVVNKNGFTALHVAAQKGYWVVTMMLLAAGARTDIVDKYGFTPFHWAALNGHRLVVAALLTVSDKVNVYG